MSCTCNNWLQVFFFFFFLGGGVSLPSFVIIILLLLFTLMTMMMESLFHWYQNITLFWSNTTLVTSIRNTMAANPVKAGIIARYSHSFEMNLFCLKSSNICWYPSHIPSFKMSVSLYFLTVAPRLRPRLQSTFFSSSLWVMVNFIPKSC